MKKKQKNLKVKVFFNASVILAGLHSPQGGSAKVLSWAKSDKVDGSISEIVLDEAKRHAKKIGWSQARLEKEILACLKLSPAPKTLDRKYMKLVVDMGDVHLFTSSEKLKVDYLVSLDKKHVLSLAKKIKKFKIVSPGNLITELSRKV